MIGERIKESREKNNLTQSALAKKLGISRSAVNAWEMGISSPSAQYLIELSRLFNVTTDYLLDLDARETIDISSLDEAEKKMMYAQLDYFKKYGSTVRAITGQVEDNYDIIKMESEKIAGKVSKEILEKIMDIIELYN